MASIFHRKISAIIFFASCLAVLAAVAVFSVPAADAIHSWSGYHWASTTTPFTLKVGDNVSSAWDPYLDEAIADWNPSAVLDLKEVVGSTKPRICKAKAGQIEVCSERYGNTGWLGIAQIWISGSHITQAITKVNDTYFNSSFYNKPEWRRLVMCQEIAHDFGLGHQNENPDDTNLGSCMDYTNNPKGPPSNEHPNAHDFEQIEIIYGHLDGITTVAQTTVSGFGNRAAVSGAGGEDSADWGRAVRTSSDGRPSLFERDLGAGNKVFTFVIWARK